MTRGAASLLSGLAVLVGLVAPGSFVHGSSTTSQPSLLHPAKPSWAQDAPDPDVFVAGSQYYAFTTGTTWGNNLGVLKSSSALGAWKTLTGHDYASTALPKPPSWETKNSQTSPTVARIDGRYLLYYDATLASDASLYCLSVATSSSPATAFVDHSTSHFGPCSKSFNGSVDPDVVALGGGKNELVWKENDSGPYNSSQIVAESLTANGLAVTGSRHVLLTQDSAAYPWETTTENPDLVEVSGQWWLFFSAGRWTNSTYSEAVVHCDGPSGPCPSKPIRLLTSYGSVHGPGGASVFEAPDGSWYMDFAAWTGSCTGEKTGCSRELYVAPLEFSPLTVTTASLPGATVGTTYKAQLVAGGGYGPRAWSATGLPAGLTLSSSGLISGTPQTAGTFNVAVTVKTTYGTTVAHVSKTLQLKVAA